MSTPGTPNGKTTALGEVLRLVGEALHDLRYGEIVIQVHNGQVVQIDRTDKLRPNPPPLVSPRT
jgi:hypothetical protein